MTESVKVVAASQLNPRLGARKVLLWIYGVCALLLFVSSTWVLRLVVAQIGEVYGGFVLMLDDSIDPPYIVGPELWRTAASADELHLFDQVKTIEGRSAGEFGEVFASLQSGDLVTYEIQRGESRMLIQKRAERFTFDRFLVSHGLLYLTGTGFLIAGFALLWATRRQDLTIMAFVFLPAAAAWLTHSTHTNIARPDAVHPAFDLLVWTPALPLVAAFLLHLALVFPTPHGLATQRPWLVWIPYALAAILISTYRWGRSLDDSNIDYIVLAIIIVFAAVGVLSQLLACARGYWLTKRKGDIAGKRIVETVVALWLVAAGVFVVLGFIPFVILEAPLMPWEIWISVILMFPPVAVYALRNAEVGGQLQEEVIQRQRYADKVAELHGIREQTLHEVADALHDRVIPDLRGLHFAAVAAGRRLVQPVDPALADDLHFITSTLNQLSNQTRAIMEGTKPVDWAETDLGQALVWLVNSFQHANPRLQVALETTPYDESDPPTVKEALYLITRAALSNVQEHAQAGRVDITLRSSGSSGVLHIADDGRGFDPAAAPKPGGDERRHLGLGNMSLRAAEIGAHFEVSTQPGRGTAIAISWERER
ncbi:MAG: hypothetical protein K1X65_17665 [Caldilineales bacterium]|nr:hypothetical protein [Caldilineales bacterium]